MDELTIEDFKMLILHYSKRANDSELKNAELQLILSRLRNIIKDNQSEIIKLNSEIQRQSDKLKSLSAKKSTTKTTKVKELE